jgi:hypothetical protein
MRMVADEEAFLLTTGELSFYHCTSSTRRAKLPTAP